MCIASKKAKFGQPETGLGIIPGFSGTQRLPRLVGIGRAKELLYTGSMLKADEACRIGLVNRVTEADRLMEECRETAARIVRQAPVALRYAKEAVNRGIETDLDTGIALENELFGLCFATRDQKIGMKGFLEKTEVTFNNN